MKSKTKRDLAGAVGIIIGLLSIVSGSAVLLGIKRPNYIFLSWLVIYNVVMGFVSVIAGAIIWENRKWSVRLSLIVASAHTTILLILILVYIINTTVALESLGAITFRALVWVGITLTVWKNKDLKNYHS